MKLLLDSHTLIWWVDHHDLVGEGAKSAILEEGSELYVSAGSVLEIAIKVGKGKLRYCMTTSVRLCRSPL